MTLARFRSACSRVRSARSGSTVIAAWAAILSTCPYVFPRQAPGDHRLRPGLVRLAQQLERVVDGASLGVGESPVLQERADARQQGAEIPRGLHEALRRYRAHRQGERDVGGQRLRPAVGQVPVVITAGKPVVVLPDRRPDQAQLGRARPRLQRRRRPHRTHDLLMRPALAPPPRPRSGLERGRQGRRRGTRVPRPALHEPGQPGSGPATVADRIGARLPVAGARIRGRAAGRAGVRNGLLARPAPVARLPLHQLPQVDLGIHVLILERYHRAPTIQASAQVAFGIFFVEFAET